MPINCMCNKAHGTESALTRVDYSIKVRYTMDSSVDITCQKYHILGTERLCHCDRTPPSPAQVPKQRNSTTWYPLASN